MPTKNPRLTITLKPELADQLRRLSALTGNSQSALISELLDGSGPVFDRMISILEAAKHATAAMRGKIAADLDAAQSQVEGALGFAIDKLDSVDKAASAADQDAKNPGREPRRKAQRGGGHGADSTPISNRGVRYDPTATKKIAQSRLSVRSKSKKVEAKIKGGE